MQQDPDRFESRAWEALSLVENHFAALGGAAAYVGFHPSHPVVLVAVVLLGLQTSKDLGVRIIESGASSDLEAAWLELAAEFPDIAECIAHLEPANRARFPAKLLVDVCGVFRGMVIQQANVARYLRLAEQRLPRPLPSYWSAIARRVNNG